MVRFTQVVHTGDREASEGHQRLVQGVQGARALDPRLVDRLVVAGVADSGVHDNPELGGQTGLVDNPVMGNKVDDFPC